MHDEPSVVIQMLGRLHPVLVHLPIGFIVVVAVLEPLSLVPRFNQLTAANRVVLLLSLPAVIISAAFGWLLSWEGGYNDELLFWHKWTGTALVPAVVALFVFHQRKWMTAYRVFLAATLILLMVAGHHGGSLTHGSDFLFPSRKYSAGAGMHSEANAPDKQPGGQSAFSALVQPILNEYCVSCHGPEKDKGGLKLDTAEHIFTGGDSGEIVQRGNANQSLMIKRMLLPEEEDEHMPPAGKPQPSAAHVALLKWWINVGAPVDKTTEELTLPAAR